MIGLQCGNCIKNRGNLTCDAYPEGMPDKFLTGRDRCKHFKKVPDSMRKSLQTHVNSLLDTEEERYTEIKQRYKQKHGAKERDFEPGGKYYGLSVNQLIDLL